LRIFSSDTVIEQLKLSTEKYLSDEVVIHLANCQVLLPRLLEMYRSDFGKGYNSNDILLWTCKYIPEDKKKLLNFILGQDFSIKTKSDLSDKDPLVVPFLAF